MIPSQRFGIIFEGSLIEQLVFFVSYGLGVTARNLIRRGINSVERNNQPHPDWCLLVQLNPFIDDNSLSFWLNGFFIFLHFFRGFLDDSLILISLFIRFRSGGRCCSFGFSFLFTFLRIFIGYFNWFLGEEIDRERRSERRVLVAVS